MGSLFRWSVGCGLGLAVATILAAALLPIGEWPHWVRVIVGVVLGGHGLVIMVAIHWGVGKYDWSRGTITRRAVGASVAVLLVGSVNMLVLGRLQHLIHFLPMWAAVLPGMLLVGKGMSRRVGDRRHCPKCDYPCEHGLGEEPARCPECGHEWRGRWVLGDKQSSPGAIAAGVGAFVVGIALMMATMEFEHGSSWTPTRVLIWQAQSNVDKSLLWTELARRSVTPEQREQLAESVIEQLPKRKAMIAGGAEWLASQVVAGTIQGSQRERALDALACLRVVPVTHGLQEDRPQIELQAWEAAHATGLSDFMHVCGASRGATDGADLLAAQESRSWLCGRSEGQHVVALLVVDPGVGDFADGRASDLLARDNDSAGWPSHRLGCGQRRSVAAGRCGRSQAGGHVPLEPGIVGLGFDGGR